MTMLLYLLVVTNGIWLFLYLDMKNKYDCTMDAWVLACNDYNELLRAAREAARAKAATEAT